MKKKQTQIYPPGGDEAEHITMMAVPTELAPKVRALIAKKWNA